MFITISGQRHYLWRAVGQHGNARAFWSPPSAMPGPRPGSSAFSGISPHFRPGRHRLPAEEYRREMTERFTTWNQITGTATAA